jgi:hypothetical protein
MLLLFAILFENLNPLWIIPCFLFGFSCAWFLYQKSNVLAQRLKWNLFFIRGSLISLLAFLLLSPLLKSTIYRLEKPLVIIAQDASSSINSTNVVDTAEYHQNLRKLAKQFGADFEVKILNFGDEVKPGFDFRQQAKTTDIASVFSYVNEQYSNRNIGALILASDGIINRGTNPNLNIKTVHFPIYSIALGDTIPKKDVLISLVNYNKLVYLGSDHQIEIHVSATKSKGKKSNLRIKTNDGQNQLLGFEIDQNDWQKTFSVKLQTLKKGVQKISILVDSIAGELSNQNNQQTVFVEVIDGREKVLIVADGPHPDISALKESIESNKNYEVKLAFADAIPTNIKDFGLIIFHALPTFNHPISAFLKQSSSASRWFIIGSNSDLSTLGKQQNLLNMATNSLSQEYFPVLNEDFYAFSLSDNVKNMVSNSAPLIAPFGNYALKGSGIVLLHQKIGNVLKSTPLLSFGNDGGIKTAILSGEGIWRWRLQNFEKNENHAAFDELITKTVQYLTAKEDKRKFRVFPIKNGFLANEHIILQAELYNDAYNLINEPEVSAEIKSETGKKYSFLFSKQNKAYQLDAGVLPYGVYNYSAKTQLGEKKYQAQGQFLIEDLNIEMMKTTADHQLLYNLAKQSGGVLIYPNEIGNLKKLITNNEAIKTISFSESSYDDLIHLKWFFALLILLLAAEWFLRKRNGGI